MSRAWLTFCVAGITLSGVLLLVYHQRGGEWDAMTRHAEPVPVPSCPRCSLILLNIEMLRADYVGLINQGSGATPNIDEFFSSGVTFTDVYSGSGATYLSATATATATETMLNEHNVWGIRRPGGGGVQIPIVLNRDGRLLIDYFPTISQILDRNGYRTVAFNQWIHSGEMVSLDRGFDDYKELPKGDAQMLFGDQVSMIVDSLRTLSGSMFYLYFHPNSLHFNFHMPYDRAASIPGFVHAVEHFANRDKDRLIVRARKRSPNAELVWQAYEAQIRYVDDELGRLFEYLTRSRLLESTIVVLYSNHGTGMDEHGKLEVGLPHKPFLHVPLLIRLPGLDGQIRIDSPVSLVDLAPTLYSLLEIDLQHRITTNSMSALIGGGNYSRRYIFSKDIQYESVRRENWKLVVKGGEMRELYNVESDPEERDNVYKDYPVIARELELSLMEKHLEQSDYSKKMKAYFNVPQ